MNYPQISRIAKAAILLASLAGSLAVVWHGMLDRRSGISDFAGYYTASTILARGDSVSRMYDDEWFVGRLKSLGLRDTMMIMYVNPPCAALIMTPLVDVPATTAKFIWNCVNLLLVFLLWLVARRVFEIPPKSAYGVLFAGIILSTIPFLRDLQRGQVYVLMLLLVLLLYYGITKNHAWLTGGSLAALLLLKYFGWMFLVYFVVTRRWKELAYSLALTAIVTVGMGWWFGWGLYEAHFARLFSAFAHLDAATTNLPCVPAFLGGLFVYHPLYNPAPIADAPSIAVALTLVSLAATLGLSLRSSVRAQARTSTEGFFPLLILSVVFTPLAAEHHYLLLLPALWYYLFSGTTSHDRRSFSSTLLLTYLLLGWFPAINGPILAWYSHVIAYPHLFGAMLLWSGFLWTGSPGRHIVRRG